MTKDQLTEKASIVKAKISRKKVVITTAIVAGTTAAAVAVLKHNQKRNEIEAPVEEIAYIEA